MKNSMTTVVAKFFLICLSCVAPMQANAEIIIKGFNVGNTNEEFLDKALKNGLRCTTAFEERVTFCTDAKHGLQIGENAYLTDRIFLPLLMIFTIAMFKLEEFESKEKVNCLPRKTVDSRSLFTYLVGTLGYFSGDAALTNSSGCASPSQEAASLARSTLEAVSNMSIENHRSLLEQYSFLFSPQGVGKVAVRIESPEREFGPVIALSCAMINSCSYRARDAISLLVENLGLTSLRTSAPPALFDELARMISKMDIRGGTEYLPRILAKAVSLVDFKYGGNHCASLGEHELCVPSRRVGREILPMPQYTQDMESVYDHYLELSQTELHFVLLRTKPMLELD